VPAIALFGLILGLLYERSGSLVGPIVAHALFNAKTMLWESLGGG
jgi:membrane protease YdiL (CAAX protease family)